MGIRYKKDHEQALKARIKPHHAQGCLKIVQAALGAYLGAENGILNNHRLKTVGFGYGLKARIRID